MESGNGSMLCNYEAITRTSVNLLPIAQTGSNSVEKHYSDIFIEENIFHYNDVIMVAMASQITSLTIVYSPVYSGRDKKNIKAPRHWPLCGEFTGDRWIPRTKGQ